MAPINAHFVTNMLEYKFTIDMATRAVMEGSVESTDVNNAVDHLHEIAHVCKSSGSRAGLIDEVVTILKDMDVKRLAAHEALEAETIACSMLRHQVTIFPDMLKAEIAAATEAARQSNAAQLKQLQGKLSSINENDTNCRRRNEVLELHNEVLSTEEKSLSVKYNDLMKKLNKSMLEKSNMRIILNETRNNLAMTQQQVTNTENKLMELNEAMANERKLYQKERTAFTDSLASVNSKCDDQIKADVALKKDLVILESKAVEIELDAEEKRKECCRIEARIKRMNSKSQEIQEQMKEGEGETERLQNEQKQVNKQQEEMIESYASKKAEMIEKTEQYTKEIASCTVEVKKLTSTRKALKKEHKKAQDEANTQKLTLTDVQENVNTSKHTLKFQSEEASRLVNINQELELGLVQLQESHKVTVAVMKEQIGKLKEQLVKERHMRQEVMEELLELQRVKEKEQVEQTRALKEANTEIRRQKNNQDQVSEKTESLHKDIEHCRQQTDHLTMALKATKRRLNHLVSSLTDQKSSLETLIASQQSSTAEIDNEYEITKPKLKKSEEEYKEKTTQYEAKKKDIILVKNKQTSLEERIARAKKTLGKMHIPQEKLRMNILRCRAYTRLHIREHSVEVDKLERMVISTVCKLNVVRKENERLRKITELLKEEIERLARIASNKEELEAGAMAKLAECRESLQQAWMEDSTLDETFAMKDNVVLEEMNNIREASESRQHMLQVIQKRFDEELSVLTEFIDTVTTK